MSDDFDAYYDAELRPALESLEERRRQASRTWRTVAGVTLVVVVGALVAAAALSYWIIAAVAVVLGAGCLFGSHAILFHPVIRDAKREMIGALARFVDPSLRYSPKGCITRAQFRRSRLFSHGVDRYRGEDLVQGRIGSTDIRFSEVHAQYKTTHTDGKGHTHTSWHTIFKGLFVIADFNKHFRGVTRVLPDVAERALGWFGQKLQGAFDVFERGELVKLEDPEFEREFVVYADDQVEARYILTPALMRRLLDFKRRAGRDVCFSFAGSSVHIAISTSRDMFEPDASRSFLDRAAMLAHLRDLQFATSVVKELDLNTRIWTKE